MNQQQTNHSIWNLALGKLQINMSLIIYLAAVVMTASVAELSGLQILCYVSAFLLALLVHDATHLLIIRLKNYRVETVKLLPFGAYYQLAGARPEKSFYFLPMLVSAACSLCLAGFELTPDLDLTQLPPLDLFVICFGLSSFNLAVINLLPVFPSDLFLGFNIKTNANRIIQYDLLLISVLLSLAVYVSAYPAVIIFTTFLFLSIKDNQLARNSSLLTNYQVADFTAFRDQLVCLSHLDSLSSCIGKVLPSSQSYFPVLLHGKLKEIYSKEKLIKGYLEDDNKYLNSIKPEQVFRIDLEDGVSSLSKALKNRVEIIAVIDDGEFFGLIYADKIPEIMMIKSIHKKVGDAMDDL